MNTLLIAVIFAVLIGLPHNEAASLHGKILKATNRVKRQSESATCNVNEDFTNQHANNLSETKRTNGRCSVLKAAHLSKGISFHVQSTSPYRVCNVPENYVGGSPKRAEPLCNNRCLLPDSNNSTILTQVNTNLFSYPLTTLVRVWTSGTATHPRQERWIRLVVGHTCAWAV